MVITVSDPVVEDFSSPEETSHTQILSDAVVGDIRVIAIAANPDGTGTLENINLPSGWTGLGIQTNHGAASDGMLFVIFRVVQTGDSHHITITTSQVCMLATICVTYKGVDVNNPIDVATPAYDITESPPTYPDIVTVTNNARIGRVTLVDGAPGFDDSDIPIGTTLRGTMVNNPPANGQNLGFADEIQAIAGSAGSADWGGGAGAEEAVSMSFALREQQPTFKIEGNVRDLGLSAVGNVRCILVKHDNAAEASRIYSIINHVNANISGFYSFIGIEDNDSQYMVIAYNDEAITDRRGCTDDDLTPIA